MLNKIIFIISLLILIIVLSKTIYQYLKKRNLKFIDHYSAAENQNKILLKIKNIIFEKIIYKILQSYNNYLYKNKLREFLEMFIRMIDENNIYDFRMWDLKKIESIYGKEFTKAYIGYISLREDGREESAKKYWKDQFKNQKIAKEIINYIDQITYQNQDIKKVKQILIELSKQEEKSANIELQKKLTSTHYIQFTLSIFILLILGMLFIKALFQTIGSISTF